MFNKHDRRHAQSKKFIDLDKEEEDLTIEELVQILDNGGLRH